MYSNRGRLLYGCGSFAFIAGLVITLIWESLYYNCFNFDLKLTHGSQNYKVWSENTVPVYCKIYMFNWTNPEQTLAKTEKANFSEMGPYTFRFLQRKDNIVWNKNYTVTFRSDRVWDFVPELSNGNLSDRVTNINAVAVAIGDRVKDFEYGKFLINQVLNLVEQQEYVTKSVEELLFEGYRDQILTIMNVFKKFGINTGFMPPRFGWYINKNVTDKNIFNIHTGVDDLSLLGKVHSWNYDTQCGVYSAQCDEVQGSLGDLWPKNAAKNEIASVFVPDFCGTLDLIKVGTRKLYGVEGIRYAGTEKTLDSGVKYTKNSCYSNNSTGHIASGVRDVSECVHGPIYASFPHFYSADEKYRLDIDGMNPIAEKHQFSITLHKELGMLLEIFGRLQINVKIQNYPGLNFFDNLPDITIPTVWFEQYIEFQEDLKDQITLALNYIPNILSSVGYILLIVGVVLSSLGYFYSNNRRESESFNKLIF